LTWISLDLDAFNMRGELFVWMGFDELVLKRRCIIRMSGGNTRNACKRIDLMVVEEDISKISSARAVFRQFMELLKLS
jgi:hypothetical protein